MLRPDRPPKANARSSPDQMACFSSPAPRWLLGSRTVVLLALLVIYIDEHTGRARRGHGGAAGPRPALSLDPESWTFVDVVVVDSGEELQLS